MMNKEHKKGCVPVLRFPEFQDAGEWKEIKLIDTTDKKVKWSFIGGPFGSNLKSSDYTANGVRIIQLQNIGDAEFNGNSKIFTSDEKADELLSCNIYSGDIILSKMGDPVGRACLIPNIHDRYVMCSDGIRLVVDEKSYSKYFIYSLINSIQFRTLVEKTATGSTRKRIGLDDLKNLPMVVPKVREQQKIADCLSSIEELVTKQTQKVEALKAHKNGLMQQLFPAEGETVPKLRFPEFWDAGEWNTCTLDEICSVSSGGTPSRSTSSFWNGNIPWITTTLIDINTINAANEYITEEGLKNSAAKIFPKNTILMAMYGQGKTRGKVAILGIDAAINQACAAITLKKGFDTNFVFQNLAARYDEIRDISNKGGQENLSAGLIKGIPFTYPDVKSKEQQKIANCLSSIDDLITAQAQKLNAFKTHKKGLMQQLFPAVDEVAV
jgi:type I restriction enzyme S subunit